MEKQKEHEKNVVTIWNGLIRSSKNDNSNSIPIVTTMNAKLEQ